SFYLPLALLHVTLVARVAADLAVSLPGREWGALGNATSIALFIVVLAVSVARAALEARRRESARARG
ncbi:MAG: hypothetical protein K8T20_17420, partial [Planctomycetes bacterium]|nr:hypothetical protein [Planctomycetota bacterium]